MIMFFYALTDQCLHHVQPDFASIFYFEVFSCVIRKELNNIMSFLKQRRMSRYFEVLQKLHCLRRHEHLSSICQERTENSITLFTKVDPGVASYPTQKYLRWQNSIITHNRLINVK